ncbi:MAG: undecaprenyl/decaprenyl-phosphate alpha-N-acetylglucosaminyl 1-phosphate transferase [Deltaproteobacteria bacterium]|nr:undecaprenyl/decaprenyl-phosphate alpha-N-acetylglucosaminyl 1-phosphate transferase [Deltaproteobacteria bacterium]
MCIDNAKIFKPQRMHILPTPRAGGLGIFAGSLIVLSLAEPEGMHFVMSALPVFLIGFVEDLSSSVNPFQRLLIIAAGAGLGSIFMDAVITDIGFLTLPLALAIPFTVFAVTGVANAINIIDGMNGLASGISIITFFFLGLAAYIVGDTAILALSVALLAATAGFFVFNFPKGRIFLGDGGAYFIGFAIAELSVMLVNRNPEISPWFPLALMAYPVTEVAFTIFRRKVKKGRSPFMPDRAHLHSLLYKRVTRSNSRTSCVFWSMTVPFDAAAFFLLDSSVAMTAVIVTFVAMYLALYTRIVRFRTPSFLRSLSSGSRPIDWQSPSWDEAITNGVEVYKQKLGEGQ